MCVKGPFSQIQSHTYVHNCCLTCMYFLSSLHILDTDCRISPIALLSCHMVFDRLCMYIIVISWHKIIIDICTHVSTVVVIKHFNRMYIKNHSRRLRFIQKSLLYKPNSVNIVKSNFHYFTITKKPNQTDTCGTVYPCK